MTLNKIDDERLKTEFAKYPASKQLQVYKLALKEERYELLHFLQQYLLLPKQANSQVK